MFQDCTSSLGFAAGAVAIVAARKTRWNPQVEDLGQKTSINLVPLHTETAGCEFLLEDASLGTLDCLNQKVKELTPARRLY